MSSSNPPLRGRFTSVLGRRVHYHVRGSGPPVLLLHGNGSLGEEILSPFHEYDGVLWVAPDRPGYGFSEPPPGEGESPEDLADWVLAFAEVLQLPDFVLVAHSIAAGAAVWAAWKAPGRLSRLVLLAPFCRPTPHRWMLGLRLAVAPVVGRPVRRYLLPAVLPLFRRSVLEGLLDPNPVPRWLKRFPVEHAAKSQSLRTMAGELRKFNDGMFQLAGDDRVTVHTTALFGSQDSTAPRAWHEPWLRRHTSRLHAMELSGIGHAVHQACPAAALQAITTGSARE